MNAPFAATTLEKIRAELAAKPTELFIDGKFVPSLSGETFEVEDPSTAQIFAHSAAGDAADVDLAVKAARRAFEGPWGKMTPAQRARLMIKLADLIERDGDIIALTESLDRNPTRPRRRNRSVHRPRHPWRSACPRPSSSPRRPPCCP